MSHHAETNVIPSTNQPVARSPAAERKRRHRERRRDLFGCNRERQFARLEHAGLLSLLNGRKLVPLTADTATIETPAGGRQTYRRQVTEAGRVVLAWEMAQ
jgi:hypothetical protein